MTISAKYENGVFKPLENVDLREGTIVELHIPSYSERLKEKSPPVGEFEFFGLWKDRADMQDSVEYVNMLRRDLRG